MEEISFLTGLLFGVPLGIAAYVFIIQRNRLREEQEFFGDPFEDLETRDVLKKGIRKDPSE